jgi:photosystem II stability/assembly factor-like uncharacterized protein
MKQTMKKFLFTLLITFLLFAGKSISQTWTSVNSTGTTFILYGMSFPSGQNNIGYACGMHITYNGNGVIVKTVDGGNNWTQIWPVSGTVNGLQGIWFTSELVGFACGWNNYFIKTTDGGTTWNPITVGTGVWYYVDVEFWDSNNGIALAKMNNPSDQAAFITSDGGNNWVPSTSGLATADVMGLSYASQTMVYAVGTSGNVYKSTDGGHNWSVASTVSAMGFGIDFANTNFGVVGGEEKMFATTNGGSSWSTYTTGYENFYASKAFADGTGYIGGTDNHIFKTTNFGSTWAMETSSGGSSTLYRIRFTENGTGFACGSQGTILKYVPPLEADFTASATTICTGETVNFYDNSTGAVDSWSWTFEGGTPPTSNIENPIITYNTPGTYDVSLTVTAGSNNSTETKTNFITVYGALVAPNTPSGPAEVCGSYSYDYSTQPVQYAESYDWEVSPASAGTMVGDDVVATFMASNTWSGSYTIKVRAENDCGNGPWSPDFTGTLYHNPVVFDLMGDGAYCEGDPGAELTLSDSETDVNYELFKDNVSTGVIVAGTGEPVSFGLFTETGLYTAEGYTANCSETMVGQIYVHMQPVPGQAAAPQGPETVCNDETSDYITTGAANADEYTWTLDPAEAGVLTPNGDECSIDWASGFTGTASLSVTGTNDCGTGTTSDALVITVNAAPAPVVSGLTLVCDNDEAQYSTTNNAGSTYTWEVTGGTILTGAGTYMINVLWGYPGSGSVTVTETNASSCDVTSETLAVTIDDCTGLDEGESSQIQVYPNPAHDQLNITGLENAVIRVYNLVGVEVMNLGRVSGKASLNISSLQKGIYLVKAEDVNGVSVFQVVKK